MRFLKPLKQKLYRLLRWSQKYTKTDMVYLTKGGFWVSIGQAAGAVSGFVLSIAFANLLPKEAFGTYKYLRTIIQILGAVSLTGMGAAVAQSVARGAEGSLRSATKIKLKWALLVTVIALAGAGYYILNDNSELALGLLFIAVLLPFIKGFDLFAPYLKGKQAFRDRTIFNTIRSIVPAASIIATVFVTKDPLVVLLSYLISQALTITGLYFLALYRYRPSDDQEDGSATFGKHLSVMNFFGKVATNLDRILVWHFLGAAQLAVYSFAIAPVRELKKMRTVLETLAFPKLSQRSTQELRRSLPYRLTLLGIILIPIIALYILAAPYLYSLLFPRYMESVLYSQVFAVTLIFMPVGIIIESLTAHMRQRELYVIKIAPPAVRIVAVVILLPLYGIAGALGAIFATEAVKAIMSLYFFYRH